jgi:ABC-2 type transport system ATP-binding protein
VPAIDVDKITKRFKNHTVINNLSFSVFEGENFGLLGPNGAGKSTMINMMMGLLYPTSGRISILDMDLRKNVEKIRQVVALVPQTISVYESLTVYENIEFFGSLYNGKRLKERIVALMNMLLLSDQRNTIIATLSGGYQRRVSIACALIADPKIVFLDEPLTGIDIATNRIILEYLKAQKEVTIVYTTHSIQEAESLCNRVLFLNYGEKLLEGSPKDIVKEYATTFGERIIIDFDQPVSIEPLRSYLLKAGYNVKDFTVSDCSMSFTSMNLGRSILEIMHTLEPLEANIMNVDIHKASLEEVYDARVNLP